MESGSADAIRRAWDVASRELGIRVQTETCLIGPPDDARRYEVIALIPDFGRKNGTAVLQGVDAQVMEALTSAGFLCVVLGSSYETYERSHFEDTLND